MSLVSAASGTQTATLDTEHTLTSSTIAGIYVLVVDTANMANGDITLLRIKTKSISTGVSRLAYQVSYANIQGDPNKYSIPVPSVNQIVCTLEQTDGTGRNYPWNLLRM